MNSVYKTEIKRYYQNWAWDLIIITLRQNYEGTCVLLLIQAYTPKRISGMLNRNDNIDFQSYMIMILNLVTKGNTLYRKLAFESSTSKFLEIYVSINTDIGATSAIRIWTPVLYRGFKPGVCHINAHLFVIPRF